ncbi:MAG: hypothetical protein ACK44T_11335, partial [Sphingomonadales bacterium]
MAEKFTNVASQYGLSRQTAGETQMATVVAMQDRSVSIPSAEELVARAKAMIPTLKSRAKQCVAQRNVSVETIAEMQEAGF